MNKLIKILLLGLQADEGFFRVGAKLSRTSAPGPMLPTPGLHPHQSALTLQYTLQSIQNVLCKRMNKTFTKLSASPNLECKLLISCKKCSCGSVVEHCVSSAKGCGFISQETHILTKNCIDLMHCKSLWIKASAKCVNVYHHQLYNFRLGDAVKCCSVVVFIHAFTQQVLDTL